MHPVAKAACVLLGTGLATTAAWWATPKGDLILPLKLAAPIAAALGSFLVAWVSWTYLLWKRDTKRERITDALKKGRLICHCSEEGEIMTLHHELRNGDIEAYTCPVCGHFEVVYPVGEVLIDETVEFQPTLPATARLKWLNKSR